MMHFASVFALSSKRRGSDGLSRIQCADRDPDARSGPGAREAVSITNSGDPLCNGKVPRYGTGEPAVAFDPTHVPEALREPPQWVAWRYEERNSKPTKVPVNPHTGKRASSTSPLT